MPIPKRKSGERRDDFIGRCIANLKDEYPEDQAAAICYEQLSEGDSSDMYKLKQHNSLKKMTNSELKELVKKHFSLVEAPAEEVIEETFGEIKDINKAFTLKFPGDTLEVGDKVTVVTSEGQEMDAPNGTHELENGTKIVTEDSVVKEITAASETALQEEEDEKKEEMAEVKEEVEGVEKMEEEEEKEEMMMLNLEDIVEAVVSGVKEGMEEEMKKMKDKMTEFEKKMEKMSAAPAAKKTLPTPTNEKVEAFKSYVPNNADKIELMRSAMKNKFKK